jgi:protein tyrosine/serine phosphatase
MSPIEVTPTVMLMRSFECSCTAYTRAAMKVRKDFVRINRPQALRDGNFSTRELPLDYWNIKAHGIVAKPKSPVHNIVNTTSVFT